MKKLIFGLAFALSASVAVAATSINWSSSLDGIGAASLTKNTEATTIYLINSVALSQASIWDGVFKYQTSLSDVIGSSYVGTATMSEGVFAPQNGIAADVYTAGTYQNLYMVCYDANVGDIGSLYFSEAINQPILGNGATPYSYMVNSSYNENIQIGMGSFDASVGGWVTQIPEPTSGLLLLLGFAGLALRRKRA